MSATLHPNPTLQRWRGLARFGADAYAQAGTQIQRFHRAIARQPFAVLDTVPLVREFAAPVRVLHDGITDAVYLAVREVGALTLDTVATGLALAERETPAKPSAAPPQLDAVASAISGAFGDHLAARRNPLAPRAGFYVAGQRVALQTDALRTACPSPQRRLAIFVHGLCCNETSWRLYHDATQVRTRPYGDQLAAHGYSSLYLRYNSGAHIAHNGRRFARLLERLVARWPVPVDEIVLIGHSMGGLVIRTALADAMARGSSWTNAVRQVICLGTPHRGAALEKIAHGTSQLLKTFELSRAWGEALELRSVGIRDLRFGATSVADWRNGKQKNWRPAQAIARLPHARYHFIGSSIGVDARDWRGRLLGDGLVHLPSSLAAELADADTATLFGKHHMQLLNDPQVYALLAERLGLTAGDAQAAALSG